MTLINDSVYDYFQMNYRLHKEGWSIEELELMTPFDRVINQQLFIADLKKRIKDKENV